MKRGWWYSASTEDRLAQIDGAIELGMTAKQCAMNCGCVLDSNPGGNVTVYAHRHGRNFPAKYDTPNRKQQGNVNRKGVLISRRRARLDDDKQAYLSGEAIDMWSVE